jgi:hypothetical protein
MRMAGLVECGAEGRAFIHHPNSPGMLRANLGQLRCAILATGRMSEAEQISRASKQTTFSFRPDPMDSVGPTSSSSGERRDISVAGNVRQRTALTISGVCFDAIARGSGFDRDIADQTVVLRSGYSYRRTIDQLPSAQEARGLRLQEDALGLCAFSSSITI